MGRILSKAIRTSSKVIAMGTWPGDVPPRVPGTGTLVSMSPGLDGPLKHQLTGHSWLEPLGAAQGQQLLTGRWQSLPKGDSAPHTRGHGRRLCVRPKESTSICLGMPTRGR